jgi:hypothetical protein
MDFLNNLSHFKNEKKAFEGTLSVLKKKEACL